jgi:autonomous glycyl radical cofactor GrcA
MIEEKDNVPLKSFSNSTWLLDEEKKKDRQISKL